nr:zinc finger, CCHC-type [Tanacetum cinerariifolium]
MTTSSAKNSVFRGFFEKQKLAGPNFIDWYQQLRIVLSIEDKLNYLEQRIPPAPVAPAGQHVAPEILAAQNAWIKGSKEIAGLMLMTMEPEIQRNLEPLHAHEMLRDLKTLLSEQAKQELLQTTRDFHSCRKEEGPSEYDGFVQNYNMHSMGKTVNELHAMLKFHEQTLHKNNAPALHAIRAGHWKRNCPQYLAELLKKKKNAASGAGVSGVISVSRLYEDVFINRFVNNIIQISRNNMVYFSAIPRDGIFEINLYNSCTNESSIYGVSNKRSKLNLDSALLWHCRLGHISKKRIEKLQHDGLLDSSDLRAFEKCVSCMSGKMARKPYTHQVERAKDLLGLIHTDVCGPFKIMSRQGTNYFVTFTDDFSRYGYVYLLKHKHEVFETFKVFQKEVENQLGKTIKNNIPKWSGPGRSGPIRYAVRSSPIKEKDGPRTRRKLVLSGLLWFFGLVRSAIRFAHPYRDL